MREINLVKHATRSVAIWQMPPAIVENLWDKYAVSSQALDGERENTLAALKGFLTGLGYMGKAQ